MVVSSDFHLRVRQRTSLGALSLIGLGSMLLAHNALPAEQHDGAVHAALVLGSIAASFGALYALTEMGRRWAHIPAIFFGVVSGIAWLSGGTPWQLFGFPLEMPVWPVLLILVGVWVMRGSRRWA
jgi:hypothetical protein